MINIPYKVKTVVTLTEVRHESKEGQCWILSIRSKTWNLYDNGNLIMSIPEKLVKTTELYE